MKSIPQRELRNHIGRVLKQVEAGERLRVTVDGRPVAELVPIGGTRRTYVAQDEVARLLARAPLDAAFAHDVEASTGARVDEL